MSRQKKSTVSEVTDQATKLIDEEWEDQVLKQLPRDAEEQAFRLGAFVRCREIQSVGDLLRALLAYVVCVSSCATVGLLGCVAWSSQHFRYGLAQAVQSSQAVAALAVGSTSLRSCGSSRETNSLWLGTYSVGRRNPSKTGWWQR